MQQVTYYRGGAIDFQQGSSITIAGSLFNYNGGTNVGGAVGIQTTTATARIQDCVFSFNDAASIGGALYVNSGTFFLIRSNFTSNRLTGDVPVANLGAHLGTVGANLVTEITNCTFRNGSIVVNSFFNVGGVAIFYGPQTITGCVFENNSALVGAGFASFSTDVVTLNGCTFRGNFAQYGAALYRDTGPLVVLNSLFEDNRASLVSSLAQQLVGGCGIAALSLPSVFIQGSTFRRSYTLGTGGIPRGSAVYVAVATATVTIADSIFEDNLLVNSTRSLGAAIVVEQAAAGVCNFYLNRTRLVRNAIRNAIPATLDQDFSAGSVYVYVPFNVPGAGRFSLAAFVSDCDFINNTALVGPGIGMQDCNATITNSSFIGNTATVGVGAVYHVGSNASTLGVEHLRLSISGIAFSNNTVLQHPIVDLRHRVSDLYSYSIISSRSMRLSIGKNITWSQPPSSWYLDASVGFGRSIVSFDDFEQGAVARMPVFHSHGETSLDVSRVQAQFEGCLFWFTSETGNLGTVVKIGQYDMTCKNAQLRNFEIQGNGTGRFRTTGRVVDLLGYDQTVRKFTSVEFVNEGEMFVYNTTVRFYNGANFTSSPGAFLHFFLHDYPAQFLGDGVNPASSFRNYGWMRLSTLKLENMNFLLFANSTWKHELTNFWPQSYLLVSNGSVQLDGVLRLDSSPMRKYSEPTRGSRYEILRSSEEASEIGGSWSSVEFAGGYRYDLSSSDRAAISATVVDFFPLQARARNDRTGFDITFPRPANTSGPSCSSIFTSASLASLVLHPQCAWKDTSTLSVSSSKFPTTLQLLPAVISDESDSQMRVATILNVTILPALAPTAPVIVFVGSQEIPTCAELNIDARGSYYLGDPDLVRFSWSLIVPTGLSSLSAYVSAEQGPVLSVAANRFPVAPGAYSFALTIFSGLGLNTTSYFNVSRLTNREMTLVAEGGLVRTPLFRDPLQLNVRLEIPACVTPPGTIVGRWTVISGPEPSKPMIGISQFSLWIPARSLVQGQSTVFQFRAWDPSVDTFDAAKSRISVAVTPAATPRLVLLSTGHTGLVPSTQTINLTNVALDPDLSFATIPDSQLIFKWEVLNCPGKFDGSISTGQIAANFLNRDIVPITASQFTRLSAPTPVPASNATIGVVCSDLYGGSVTILPTQASFLTIVGGSVPLGQFLFGVTAFSADGRTASHVVSVTTTNGTVHRLIHFSSAQFASRKILSNEKFVVSAAQRGNSTLPSSGVSARWSDTASTNGILSESSTKIRYPRYPFLRFLCFQTCSAQSLPTPSSLGQMYSRPDSSTL